MKRVSFPTQIGFYTTVKERVNQYFTENGISKKGNWRMFLKTGIILAWLAVSYILLVYFTTSLIMAIITAFALAQGFVLVGFNIMHDGAHGSYSKNKKINWIMGFTLDLIGGSNYLWRQKHNFLHHTFTNINELDTDLDSTHLIRLSPDKEWRPVHRFQHLYAFPLYSLMTLSWISIGDFQKFLSGQISGYELKKPSSLQVLMFFFTKIFYFGYMLVLPMFFHPVLYVIITFIVIHMILGFTLAIVFQLAHLVEGNTFPKPDSQTGVIDNEWAIHEVETTANFATDSKIAAWYLGGLNFQIEHHLFSRICHIHYPAISKIVKETCQEFGISYKSFETIRSAIAIHYRYLKHLGTGATNPAPEAVWGESTH